MSDPHFLCLQRPRTDGPKQDRPSPAAMEEMYAKFNAWKDKYQAQLVDMGGPLRGQGKLVTLEGTHDGPFAELKEVIGGYMIVSAPTLEEAVTIASACPGVVSPGSNLQVVEIGRPG